MRLSRKGRFAITAMMNLALNAKKGPMTLTQLTHDQGISLSYLEQIFARLRQENLVSGVRGPGGGYCLARPANEISISDIVSVIDETAPGSNTNIQASLHLPDRSPIHAMWYDLSTDMHDFLGSISLEDSVNRYHEKSQHFGKSEAA